MLQLILNSEMKDLLDSMSSLDTDQLDVLSEKLKTLQNAVSVQSMNAIRFDQLDDLTDRKERLCKLRRFVVCNKSDISGGFVDPGNNYCHYKSSGEFQVGPNKLELRFECDVGDVEGDQNGTIDFGGLWGYELEYGDREGPELWIEKCFIKDCVVYSGIKGVKSKGEGAFMDCINSHLISRFSPQFASI